MSESSSSSSSTLQETLLRLSNSITSSLAATSYTPPKTATISVKAFLEPLLTPTNSIKDFALACALLSSSTLINSELLSWIPNHLSSLASASFFELSQIYLTVFNNRNTEKVAELGLDCDLVPPEKRLLIELFPELVPILKERIKESSFDKSDEFDEFSAASARVPVGFAILAAYQFRWFVTQVDYPHLGKLCGWVIPCALTAVDHWSPEVKGQGMVSFAHLGKNVDAAELGGFEDVILDACCQNIAADDEVWDCVVEASITLMSLTQKSNPRSPWFEKMLNEMLSHLERQPRNKERRIAWLKSVDSLLNGVGLVLLAHFRRIFPLFFQWMHADDDDTIILVLKCTYVVLRLTWIRNSPYVARLVDKLALVYKEAALRKAREEIRANITQILVLLQESKGQHFNLAWDKHQTDPDLTNLNLSLSGNYKCNLDSLPSENSTQSSGIVQT
ncbi:hypothetical protein MtrunA17_Chr3g0112991 [Medicago truncatula]|uniref:ARM repeat protein n=1 Tax=Medicago truncatula TaxID=3880 RepID=G7JAN0_MEDTR|nr:uncharacterized protein At2g39910 [Medicago truncatula]AES71094.2 ARM repeat protein [Medicago truncatula]AFK37840.1 unknown [Medicago truncatula]RHN68354.1 hypothetical protein MtrunA17_Chr3g0112991 [Medicago truncatula]